ncbi:gamma-glutamyltransferase family protein [Microbacterium sp. Root53]|jgi:gamma-glutamyltranspeptidase/glutathione hydrolase|uniref:gamma-glutamyltransferase family protein n=1 Tax=Microbacterium sp. Root53 TaxID=1736553 RepID=UPI0006FAC3E3|nr:gamma-glutamyltransferase [Microbacterium sp. Root53]KQY96956.1 transferase [Microbacterium sp. Root53]
MSFTPPPAHLTRPDLRGRFGMVASTHWLASASAQAVLERGGNAFDATVTAAFVLHVVEPHLNGPGGDMTAVFATAEAPSTPVVLMGQGPAPAGATIAHYRAQGLDLVPGSGALAAAVPGAVDAWLLLLRDHGTWPLADVLDFAIGYATDGHPALRNVCTTIAGVADLFRDHWPTSADRWMPDGRVPEPGDILYARTYAALLRELGDAASAAATREEGVDAARELWRERVGRAAEEFVRAPHRHSDGGDHAGVLTAADVAAFAASYEDAVSIEFRGHTIAKTGPWGQGPVLLQALRILDGFEDERLDPSSELGAHTVLEALKLALADRDAWYGEDVAPDVLAHLLSEEYAAARRALIADTASREVRPGAVPGHPIPTLPPLREARAVGAGVGEPTVRAAGADLDPDAQGRTRGDTCHVDVVDRWGNIVSATPSGGWLQSSPEIPELGFCLGTRLQMSWLDESSPSRLQAGRRPRTTLTPTLVLRDGRPVMALGSPGGDQQDQWQLLMLLRVLVGGYTPQQAIDAPALNTTSMHGSFWPRTGTPAGAVVEDRLGDDVIAGLVARGHAVTRAGEWALGRLSAVTRDPRSGLLGAAANPRGAQGYAVGR